jgi:hypothetical protein
MFAIPIPMALPLASCQPGPIHSTPDGRVWFGRADRVNPDTQMFEEASLTLTSAPRQGDEIWVDGNSIAIEQNGGQPWPTLDDLERAIAEARAALAGAPRFHAAAAEVAAAAERERQEEDQRGEEWLAAIDAPSDQPDLSELDDNDHPALTPSQRNTTLQ